MVPDDDHGLISEEEEQQNPRSQTPPTPAHHQPSPSPPRPIRQRAMAQLRPVSIPNIVSEMAGPDPLRRIADFDRHYMPDGQPADKSSSHWNSDAHRSELEKNETYDDPENGNYLYYTPYCNYCHYLHYLHYDIMHIIPIIAD